MSGFAGGTPETALDPFLFHLGHVIVSAQSSFSKARVVWCPPLEKGQNNNTESFAAHGCSGRAFFVFLCRFVRCTLPPLLQSPAFFVKLVCESKRGLRNRNATRKTEEKELPSFLLYFRLLSRLLLSPPLPVPFIHNSTIVAIIEIDQVSIEDRSIYS